jgi:hypothetical protein
MYIHVIYRLEVVRFCSNLIKRFAFYPAHEEQLILSSHMMPCIYLHVLLSYNLGDCNSILNQYVSINLFMI